MPPDLLAPQLYSVYTKFQVLYGATLAAEKLPPILQSTFWTAYEQMEVSALKAILEMGPSFSYLLAEPLEQLFSYHHISKLLDWYDGGRLVANKMRNLVLQYLQLLEEQEAIYDYESWGPNFQSIYRNDDSADPWSCLSPKDWINLWSSILLLAYNKHFCMTFAFVFI